MKASTIFMPCNESGYHNVSEAIKFGWAQYDWSNAKKVWVNHHPMDCGAMLTEQAAMVHARDPSVKLGVYRQSIKALPWLSVVREKLEDPAYSSWFIKFGDYKAGTNHSSGDPDTYNTNPCDATKCSGLYHEQTQVPEWTGDRKHVVDGNCQEECDCGKLPCGNYIFDHRNDSFSEWFLSDGGPIISEHTILLHNSTGIVGLYLDDQVTTNRGGSVFISEANTYFQKDTGLSIQQGEALLQAFKGNMERLYDRIIHLGGFAWQMFWEPDSNGQADGRSCHAVLGNACKPNNPDFEQRPLLYGANQGTNGTFDYTAAEQSTVNFLLTRGKYALLGYDWNGCYGDGVNGAKLSQGYHRSPLWDTDFGVPLGSCFEVGKGSGLFQRNWSKATVRWNCSGPSGKRGAIHMSSDVEAAEWHGPGHNSSNDN